MKELIEYNYKIEIDNLDEGNETFSFFYNNELYILIPYKRNKEDLKDIIECSKELKLNKITSFDIIQNKKEEVITIIEEKEYILIKVEKNYKEKLDINDLITYGKKTIITEEKIKNYKNNWGELWSSKVDYFEYQVNQLGHGKDIVIDSFSYFIGLAENAISMVNKANKNNDYGKNDLVSLSHRRVYYPNYILNYCNPISYIIDLFVRDIAEYIKSCFYSNEDAYLELSTFLKSIKLSNYSYQMLYARLVFPSLYFDLYENAIDNYQKEEDILNVVKHVDNYEFFLKDVYNLICTYSKIEKIDWL